MTYYSSDGDVEDAAAAELSRLYESRDAAVSVAPGEGEGASGGDLAG